MQLLAHTTTNSVQKDLSRAIEKGEEFGRQRARSAERNFQSNERAGQGFKSLAPIVLLRGEKVH